MRVVFLIFLNFLLINSAIKAQIVINDEGGEIGRLIECGTEENFSTEGQGNSYNNYSFLEEGDAYEGEDVLYRFVIDKESDVRLTIRSECPKGTFLFARDSTGNLIHIASSEMLRSNLDYLGAFRLYAGEYFFIIDEFSEDACNDFTIEIECTPFEPFKVCEFGGQVTTCGKTITDTLPKIIRGITPLGIPENPESAPQIQEDGCTPASFQVYQAYFPNPQTIVASLTNKTGNSSVRILTEDCGCDVDVDCFIGACSSPIKEDQSILDNAEEGFYYILVTGDSAATYDLQVISKDCDCDYTAETIECGQTVTVNAQSFPNDFFNNQSFGLNHYENCYGGNRAYNGGDVIFDFEVSTTTEVTIRLESFFAAGLFIFDANCQDDCIAHEETFGINGTARIEDFRLACGTYQIVVDLARPHPSTIDCPFTLEIEECIKADMFNVLIVEETDIRDTVNLDLDALITIENKSKKSEQKFEKGDLITFLSASNGCVNNENNSITVGQNNIDQTILFGQLKEESPREFYIDGEEIQLKFFRDKDSRFGSVVVNPVFNKDHEENKLFQENGSIDLLKVSPKTSALNPSPNIDGREPERDLNSNGGVIEFDVFAKESDDKDQKERWCIDYSDTPSLPSDVTILTPLPVTGVGSERVFIEYDENITHSTKNLSVVVKSVDSPKKFMRLDFHQKSAIECRDDKISPIINNCGTLDTFLLETEISDIPTLTSFLNTQIGTSLEYSDNCGSVKPPRISIDPFPLKNGAINDITWLLEDAAGNPATCNISIDVQIPENRPLDPIFEEYPWLLNAPINFDPANCTAGEKITIYDNSAGFTHAYVEPINTLFYHLVNEDQAQFWCGIPNDCLGAPYNLIGRETATYSCENESIIENPILALSRPLKEELLIQPNPSNGQFWITLNSEGVKNSYNHLSIFNKLGQEVKTIAIQMGHKNHQIALNLQDLNNGIYYIQLQSKDYVQSGRILINR